MDTKETTQLAAAFIYRDFEIEPSATFVSEDELFLTLVDHVDWLLEKRMEWLLSLMYRMDIDEAKVQQALMPTAPEPANIGLARLILSRQKQRAHTKLTIQPEKLEGDWGW